MNVRKRMTHFLPLLVLLSGCGSEPPAQSNREIFNFLPDGGSVEYRTDLGAEIQTDVGENYSENDVVRFFSTPSHELIATIVIPAGNRNQRLRNPDVRREMGRLAKYIKANSATGSMQVELPKMAATVQAQRSTDFNCHIIIFGTPIYQSRRHPGWNMTSGMVPTDGSLDSQTSPFCNGVLSFPAGTTVEWRIPESNFGEDHAHQEAITRHYRLFFQKHRATLIRMAKDRSSTQFDAPSQFSDRVTQEDDGVGVRLAALRDSKSQQVAVNRPIVEVPELTPQRSVTVTAEALDSNQTRTNEVPTIIPEAAEQVLSAAERKSDEIAFAINWISEDPDCDIDLHIRSKGSPDELYFVNKQTDFGKLFRDVQSSGSIEGDGANYQNWEWARIDHNRIGELTLWLNAYRSKKSATVRVICVWKGNRGERTVRLEGPGDNGKSSNRLLSPAWKEVSLRKTSK